MQEVWTWWWVVWRTSAWLSVLPVFSASSVPVRIRLIVALALSWALVPGIQPGDVPPGSIGWLEIVGRVIRETGIGLVLGYSCRFLVFAAQLAGYLIATEMGLQSGQMFAPASGESSTSPGVLLEFLALLLVFALDIHHQWITAFVQGFHWLPIAAPMGLPGQPLLDYFLAAVHEFLHLAVRLAMPVIAAGFLMNAALLLLARALPQLPVFSESFAYRIIIGLFLFGASLNVAAAHLMNAAGRTPFRLLFLEQVLGGRVGG